MNQELKNLLLEYYGELMQERDSTYDWSLKDQIIKKMNSINDLLDVPKNGTTTMGSLKRIIKRYDLFVYIIFFTIFVVSF